MLKWFMLTISTSFVDYLISETHDRQMDESVQNPWPVGLTLAGQPGMSPLCHVTDPGARKHTLTAPEPWISRRFDQQTRKAFFHGSKGPHA